MRLSRGMAAVIACAALLGLSGPARARLVAWWKFDEGQGQQAVDSVGGRKLQLHNAAWRRGLSGTALYFNGRDAFAVCELDEALQPTGQISVEAWVWPEEVSEKLEGAGIVSTQAAYVMRFTFGKPSFHIYTTRWGPVHSPGVAVGRDDV